VETLRVGIAGTGFGKNVLLPVFASLEGVRVAALSGSQGQGAGADRAFAGWRAMLDGARLDAVAFALPPGIQEDAAREAAGRGLHVFCEKPLALAPAAADAIGEACRRGARVGVVDFEFRKVPVFRAFAAEAPRLGRLRRLSVRWRMRPVAYRARARGWKGDAAAGGGAMSSFGCHLLDLCTLVLGPLQVTDYRPRTRPELSDEEAEARGPRAEDAFELRLEAAGGVRVAVEVDTLAETEDGLRVSLEGEEGELRLDDDHPENYFSGFTLRRTPPGGASRVVGTCPLGDAAEKRAQAVREVAREFVAAIRGGPPPECSLEAGIENTRLIDEARRRVRTPEERP
jgi:predicted dehydrogenase